MDHGNDGGCGAGTQWLQDLPGTHGEWNILELFPAPFPSFQPTAFNNMDHERVVGGVEWVLGVLVAVAASLPGSD